MSGRPYSRGPQSCMRKKLTLDLVTRDFTIVVCGSHFRSDRERLSSASKYFDAMFRSNMKETLQGRVVLTGMRSDIFATVLNFIHHQVPGLTPENIDEVWEAANRLDIETYLQVCEQYVIDNLSLENLSHFNQAAIDLNSENVKNGLINFMKRNFGSVLETDEFLNCPFPLVLSFVEDDELVVETEDVVLEGILSWVSRGGIKPGTIMPPVEMEQGAEDGLAEGELQPLGVQTCGVTADCQSADSRADARDGDATANTPVDVVNNANDDVMDDTSGDVISTKFDDVITIKSHDAADDEEQGDRRKYLAKLLSSAKLVLASRSFLECLLAHPYVRNSPSAREVVREALKFKDGTYPFESSLMTPYRKCSEKRNVMAYIEKSKLQIYDLETRSFNTVELGNIHAKFKTKVRLATLGSKLVFVGVKYKGDCIHVRHKCRPKAILTVDENKKISALYEVCGKQNMPMKLLNMNGKILGVCQCATRSRVLNPELFEIVKFDLSIKYDLACVFENNILLISHSDFNMVTMQLDTLVVNIYNTDTKSMTTSRIPVVHRGISTVFHKEKELFLLLSSGVLIAVKRGDDGEIQFPNVANLWNNFQWMLRGAAYYKGELFLFCVDDGTVHSASVRSVPGVFEKITVVELEDDEEFEGSNFVPLVVPASWVES
ncbi:uncharacterized protein LOC131928053 [Physella acuta]|uniref:uncharacterized protein LOC131928053 n=1 Tax=Physella acuta TaxID=109671 RepID=UPI0027DB8FBF|nr:uncharacterized protein LOC131928053 [Physella acuta]XP_059139946.1 uncharacterized protein LOC131928053 [Physella acuta]